MAEKNSKPLEITLYDEQDEPKKTYTRSIIPWRVLKKAIRLQNVDQNHLQEENVDEIASLVVETFGDQFSLDDLNNGAELGEMMTILTQIVTRAGAAFQANPTLTQTPLKR